MRRRLWPRLDRIQNLIAEARRRVDDSIATPHRLLLVAVAELNPHRDVVLKVRHNVLLRTRAAAEEAAVQALLALPMEQPGADSQDRSAQQVWDALGRGSPIREDAVQAVSLRIPEQYPAAEPRRAIEIPIRPARRKRVTLIDEISYRMAATDSGIEDERGRRLFYQEEWVQRGVAVIRYRWRVALDTSTGEHILLKRYAPLQLHGSLDDLYKAPRPRPPLISGAGGRMPRSPRAMRSNPRCQMWRAPARQSVWRRVASGMRFAKLWRNRTICTRLPANPRLMATSLTTCARRFLRSGPIWPRDATAVLDLEQNVRRSISGAETAVQDLEPLAAWANRTPKAAWTLRLDRSDREIDSARAAEAEALALLPPDSSRSEDSFPADREERHYPHSPCSAP